MTHVLSTNLLWFRRFGLWYCCRVQSGSSPVCLMQTESSATLQPCSAESSAAGDLAHNCSKIFTGIQSFSDGMQRQVRTSLGWNELTESCQQNSVVFSGELSGISAWFWYQNWDHGREERSLAGSDVSPICTNDVASALAQPWARGHHRQTLCFITAAQRWCKFCRTKIDWQISLMFQSSYHNRLQIVSFFKTTVSTKCSLVSSTQSQVQ